MKKNDNKYFVTVVMALPPLVWGIITYICILTYTSFSDPILRQYIWQFLRILCTIIFLYGLELFYKKLIPEAYCSNQKSYSVCKIVAIFFVVVAIFSKSQSLDYILSGVILCPITEELITHFVLFDAKNRGLKFYLVISILTAFTFTIMHFGYYDYDSLPPFTITQLLQESGTHFIFALGLCVVFFFVPRLEVLILIHAALNIPYIWQRLL
jgi:membrane protease YdiL (CAAX protease family)